MGSGDLCCVGECHACVDFPEEPQACAACKGQNGGYRNGPRLYDGGRTSMHSRSMSSMLSLRPSEVQRGRNNGWQVGCGYPTGKEESLAQINLDTLLLLAGALGSISSS